MLRVPQPSLLLVAFNLSANHLTRNMMVISPTTTLPFQSSKHLYKPCRLCNLKTQCHDQTNIVHHYSKSTFLPFLSYKSGLAPFPALSRLILFVNQSLHLSHLLPLLVSSFILALCEVNIKALQFSVSSL
mmetsp:Transcript_15931/g.32087  ORF Transcript_15931/g.32087 Transcript_15931/m.32087 type:complete len:130 (-) Transcript_15931:541-930(-)